MQTLGSMLYNALGLTPAQITSQVICFFQAFVLVESGKFCDVGGLLFPWEGRPVMQVDSTPILSLGDHKELLS